MTPAAWVVGIEVNNTWFHHVFMGIKGRVGKMLKNTKKKFREKKYIVTIIMVTLNMYNSNLHKNNPPSPPPKKQKQNQTNKLYLSNSWWKLIELKFST